MKIQKFGIIAIVAVMMLNGALFASDHDFGHWGAYGVKARINDKTSFSSSMEFRFKDNASDLHYMKWETGLAYKVHKVVSLAAAYRLNPGESSGEWNNAHYVILDQNFKLATNAKWDLKFRNRFIFRAGELGRGFWRTKLQLAYKFKVGESKASWYVDNEIWYQISDINGRDRYNVNWATMGFNFSLHEHVAFGPYYRLRSDKVTTTGDWKHLHILGTSLNFVF
jgi:hypothetical protein